MSLFLTHCAGEEQLAVYTDVTERRRMVLIYYPSPAKGKKKKRHGTAVVSSGTSAPLIHYDNTAKCALCIAVKWSN
jgi:hypothetical protein